MKIALLLSIVGAASILCGCSTNMGGTSDEYNVSTSTEQSSPVVADPSLPQDPNAGPQFPPP